MPWGVRLVCFWVPGLLLLAFGCNTARTANKPPGSRACLKTTLSNRSQGSLLGASVSGLSTPRKAKGIRDMLAPLSSSRARLDRFRPPFWGDFDEFEDLKGPKQTIR